MKFPAMLRILKNSRGIMGAMSSSPYSPYTPYTNKPSPPDAPAPCAPLPGETEPPWVTRARKYVVTDEDSPPTIPNPPPTSDGRQPTNEKWLDGPRRILNWVAKVIPGREKTFNPTRHGWCAAFLGAMLDDCNLDHSGSLVATSYYYNNWGGRDCGAIHGAIVIYGPRNKPIPTNLEGNNYTTGGHSGFLVQGEDGVFRILGGNQSGKVNIASLKWYNKNRKLWGYRWPSECPCPGEANE